MGRPRKKAADAAFEDQYPREIPPEKEEPLTASNWRMAQLHVTQALEALRSPDKDSIIRDNASDNLKRALEQLHPKAADV